MLNNLEARRATLEMKIASLPLLAALLLAHRAHASYHILVANGENANVESEDLFREQSRGKRSLSDTAKILDLFIPHDSYDGGSGSPTDDLTVSKEHTLQFFVKNTDPINAASTTLQDVIPSNAILTDFTIHNEVESYKHDTRNGKNKEVVDSEYQKAVSDGYSAVMIGDIDAVNSRCTDCRSEYQDGDQDIITNLNIAPGDALSVVLSYVYPVVDGKFSYRSDVTINVPQPAEHFCGVLMSPDYPDSYPNYSDLTWLLQVPAGMVVNATLLTFESESCCDHLHVYDGPSDSYPSLAVISGTKLGPSDGTVLSSGSDMLIKFQSDDSVNEGGFALQFCATTLVIDEGSEDKTPVHDTYTIFGSKGTISSPGYPFLYPPSSVITWIVTAPSDKRLVLNTIDFDVLDGETLEIRDDMSGHLLQTLTVSDYRSYITIEVPGYQVRLVFTTSEKMVYSGRGFLIRYYSEQSAYSCFFNIEATVGGDWVTISSPNYPSIYNNAEDCLWIVSTPNDASAFIEIQVSDLNLEPVFDRLMIYNGNVTDPSKVLTTLSGLGGKQLQYGTLQNKVAVQFHADESLSYSGFQLKLRAHFASYQCSDFTEILTWDKGFIANPDYPARATYRDTDCQWLISAAEDNKIDIYFQSFNGNHNYLTFYDGESSSDTVLWSDEYCNLESAVYFRSSSNKVLVRINKVNENAIHYSFRYSSILPESESEPRQHLTDAPGVIKSPNYPRFFDSNKRMEWLIQAPTDQYVNLYMDRIVLSSDDAVIFYDGDEGIIIKQCSSTACRDGTWISSSFDSMLITMTTGTPDGYFKFKFDFSENTCDLVFEFDSYSGYAVSPRISDGDPKPYCTYSISVPSGSISFAFEYFSSEACCDHLVMYDGDSRYAPEIALLGGVKSGYSGKTTGNLLTMYFSTNSGGSGNFAGFRMNYCESSHCPTGGLPAKSRPSSYAQLTMSNVDPAKYLLSPGFERQYPSDSDFFWYVECTSNYKTYFYLCRIDLDLSDYLKFYNNFGTDGSIVATVSGIDNYKTLYGYIRTEEKSTVWFHTGPFFSGKGFIIKYYC